MIGILGGMGPSATARFYQLIIDQCHKFGLKNNDEYPHIVIYNLPVPDLISDQGKKDITLNMIIKGLKKLESFGADFIVMPCNTIHLYFNLFQKSVEVPIVSLVEETVNQINYKKIGIIGSKTTITKGIFQSKLDFKGIEYEIPRNLEKISNVIKNIISGENTQQDKQFILNEISEMKDIEAVILGCTELPLIIQPKDISVPVFDTLNILANKVVKEAIKNDR